MNTANRQSVALMLIAVLTAPVTYAGLDSRKFEYVGGTWTTVQQGSEGSLDLTDKERAMFQFGKGHKSTTLYLPYSNITSLEYGQKAGRRIGATIGWGVTTLGVAALPMLLSKKRKHYFTIGFTGQDGKAEGIVVELGKNITRQTLTVFETRSGKRIEFESEDAKAHIGN